MRVGLAALAAIVIGGTWLAFGAVDGFDRPVRAVGAASGALVGAIVQVAAFRAAWRRSGRSASQVEFLRGVLSTFLLRVIVAALVAAVVLVALRRSAIPFLIGFGVQYAVLEAWIDVRLVRAEDARPPRQ